MHFFFVDRRAQLTDIIFYVALLKQFVAAYKILASTGSKYCNFLNTTFSHTSNKLEGNVRLAALFFIHEKQNIQVLQPFSKNNNFNATTN